MKVIQFDAMKRPHVQLIIIKPGWTTDGVWFTAFTDKLAVSIPFPDRFIDKRQLKHYTVDYAG